MTKSDHLNEWQSSELELNAISRSMICYTRGGPCQNGFMSGSKQWIMIQVKVIIIIMQPITIQFAVRVRKDYTPLHVYLGSVWVVIYVKYITYEGLLHNTLALDVDTVQEACVYSANWRHCVNGFGTVQSGTLFGQRSRPNQIAAIICASGQRRFAELFLLKLIKWAVKLVLKWDWSLSRQ